MLTQMHNVIWNEYIFLIWKFGIFYLLFKGGTWRACSLFFFFKKQLLTIYHMYVCIYISVCVCVCVCGVYIFFTTFYILLFYRIIFIFFTTYLYLYSFPQYPYKKALLELESNSYSTKNWIFWLWKK